MPLSNYLAQKLLDHAFRNTPYTPPATVYAALFTAKPTASGGGTEVSGGGYARKAITFGASSNKTISNSAAVIWDTATSDWGECVAWATFDAAVGGNMLSYDDVRGPRTIRRGDTPQVLIDGLNIIFDA